MPSGIGYGAAQGLESVLARLFLEQKEKQRAAEQERSFGLQQQRMDQDQSQFDTTLGFQREKFGADREDAAFTRDRQSADMAMRGSEFAQGVQNQADDQAYREAGLAMRGTEMANQNEQNRLGRESTLRAANLRVAGSQNLSPNQELLAINRLQKQWSDTRAGADDLKRQSQTMHAGLDAARRGDLAAGSQAVLVTFQKILDPTSVVRESEYARSASGQSVMNQMEGYLERLARGGAGVPIQELEKFASLADQLVRNADSGVVGRRARLERTAQQYGLDPSLIFDDGPAATTAPTPTDPAAPARRVYNPATGRVE